MWRWLLCGWLALALPQGAQDSAKDKIKNGFKTAGHAVGDTAVKVGHGVKEGAKAVGHAAVKVGHGFKEGGKAVGHGVKAAVKGDKAEKED